MKYAYYSGCLAKGTCQELDYSIKSVAKALGIELVELEETTCCGLREVKAVTPMLSLTLNARNLALTEKLGLPLFTACSTCYSVLYETYVRLKENVELLSKVNDVLESTDNMRFTGKTSVKHFVSVIAKDFGITKLRELIKVPFRNINIALFPGCHLLRPRDLYKDQGLYSELQSLVSVTGGNIVDESASKWCCGFHNILINEKITVRMLAEYFKNLGKKNVDIIVTTCPLCHVALDMYQDEASKLVKERLEIPVLHLPQMLGLAIGLHPTKLLLHKHVVPTDKLLKKLGL